MERLRIPLSPPHADELIAFWATFFGSGHPDITKDALLGVESDHNDLALYEERRDGVLAGTCLTVRSRALPVLAGFAQVATDLRFRGQGIATTLCEQAVDDFRASGGEAFFLGTVNPEAARIYHRLGWRKLAGCNVMLNVMSGASPEAFLVGWFQTGSKATVQIGDHSDRIPLIPLVWTPHNDQMLDANTSILSTRWELQNSCMGLYPRYSRRVGSGGAYFSARTPDGRVVGLSSAIVDGNSCRIDAFSHQNFADTYDPLMERATQWAAERGTYPEVKVSVEDEDKLSRLNQLGYQKHGSVAPFTIGGRSVDAVLVRKA